MLTFKTLNKEAEKIWINGFAQYAVMYMIPKQEIRIAALHRALPLKIYLMTGYVPYAE